MTDREGAGCYTAVVLHRKESKSKEEENRMSEEKRKKDGMISEEQAGGEKLSKGEGVKLAEGTKPGVSETWAEETIADLDEFIESQGIYIRQ